MKDATQPNTAFIALGSNLGHREKNLERAVELLRAMPGIEITRVSSFLDNPAVGGPDASPPFLNAAACVKSSLSAAALLQALLDVERQMGRIRRERWEPRIIDLDLLLYGDEIHRSQELTVPHQLMHERRFVLEPLAKIAPDVIHPTMRVSMATLLANLLGDR